MKKVKCKINNVESIDKFLDDLKSISIEKQPFIKPKGVFFLGKLTITSFG